ncbi:glycoside hydrolase family 88 protein [Microbacterium sp. CFBP 13617]|uniref:glycoside hydrolase family 88 protein n=1 Tax=Microbacterium sp. CFBP 13617 TaxID=2774035 RepID=UPI001782A0F8|nr:glycoside hydrolase family 88 protein [Microbacterium sp. CFBP 13617]MBD8217722.1 glycoside hydrolase family 88 protein [Microbacterium sp. CFBP 13617]
MTSASPTFTSPATEAALAAALLTIRRNVASFPGVFPDDTTVAGRYPLRPARDGIPKGGNQGWTTSFWSGMQWLAWELSGDELFRDSAHIYTVDFARRAQSGEDLDMHDIGFLYSLSSVAEWRLLGSEDARDAGLLAADVLMRRFLEPAGIIQAWGDLEDPDQQGRTIIDSLMNMPLLTWAAEQTGDARYSDAVRRHTAQLREHIIRENDSTFHTFFWNPETGEPLRGSTAQGANDGSSWSRGQAWGVYGFALNYRTTGDERDLEAAWRCADYFLAHLPANLVPYWDLDFGDGDDEPLDSSAGAITACGLLELAEIDPDPIRAERAERAARDMVAALTAHCAPARPEDSDALLLHGVYSLPHGVGVDEGNLWGDYFYLEALARIARPGWKTYW